MPTNQTTSDIAGIVFAFNGEMKCIKVNEDDVITVDELSISINNVVFVSQWQDITLANSDNVEYLYKQAVIS